QSLLLLLSMRMSPQRIPLTHLSENSSTPTLSMTIPTPRPPPTWGERRGGERFNRGTLVHGTLILHRIGLKPVVRWMVSGASAPSRRNRTDRPRASPDRALRSASVHRFVRSVRAVHRRVGWVRRPWLGARWDRAGRPRKSGRC